MTLSAEETVDECLLGRHLIWRALPTFAKEGKCGSCSQKLAPNYCSEQAML